MTKTLMNEKSQHMKYIKINATEYQSIHVYIIKHT